MAWSENDQKKALNIFRRVHPDWLVSSTETRCPQCAQNHPARRYGLNYCAAHGFANQRWLISGGMMIVLTALGDRELRAALEAESLYDYPSA